MEKVLSLIPALIMLVMIPLEISAIDGSENEEVTLDDYKLLAENPSVSAEVRTRKK